MEAIRQSREFELAPGVRIRLVTGPLFLATKFEAFLAQGQGDYYMSQDLEDMVRVVDGRIELAEELKVTIPEVRAYLATQFSALLDNDDFSPGFPGNFRVTKQPGAYSHRLISSACDCNYYRRRKWPVNCNSTGGIGG